MGENAKKHVFQFEESPEQPGYFHCGETVVSIADQPIAIAQHGQIQIFLCRNCDKVHLEAMDGNGLGFFYSFEVTSAETIAKTLLNPPLQQEKPTN